MKISYNIRKEDYLNHQLYVASNSLRIQNRNKKMLRRVPTLYVVLGILFAILGKYVLTVIFVIIAILWYFFYPTYLKGVQKRHYTAFVNEHYGTLPSELISLEIKDDQLWTTDKDGGSFINISAIDVLVELPDVYFIPFRGGASLIVPKKADMRVEENIMAFIEHLSSHYNIPIQQDLEWKW